MIFRGLKEDQISYFSYLRINIYTQCLNISAFLPEKFHFNMFSTSQEIEAHVEMLGLDCFLNT